jgi:NTP pyrophosphatase (non-canonical NTP hydrolase)
MNFEEYQLMAKETATYPEFKNIVGGKVLYPVLGLSGEVGEVVEIIKKVHRDKQGELTLETVARLRDELGDVLWYISALATVLDLSLDDIAQNNINKLYSRRDRNVLHGEGDNR